MMEDYKRAIRCLIAMRERTVSLEWIIAIDMAIEALRKELDGIEREAEPMGVLVKKWAECCGECDEIKHDEDFYYVCKWVRRLIQNPETKPASCPFDKAIGIITPDGHVKYFREEEK